ncbi:alpha-amylase family glycosyl hydrolase, partial [uncultured Amnibacterium sp.]|uniref:alpha-amylase family glycosyl hydrolase n=1 Tax=uncultured Amnibacterium sp. TaxID=1631851 RepID=UPI0035CBED09
MTNPRSIPHPLGVTLVDGGANVAVYTETASHVYFCSFDGGEEQRSELLDRTGFVWHGFVPGIEAGAEYGLRVDGPWDPERGLRHNVQKLLLDPRALAITGDYTWDQRLFGHDMNEPTRQDGVDSADAMPRCVVVDRSFDWGDDAVPLVPRVRMEETIVYETHVKGFTKRMPGIPEELQGTYAGLAHPKAIEHLVELGVTSVELMPVHQFVQDSHLLEKGLRNYWGYNSIGFFAPHEQYSSKQGGDQVAEFKSMVKALHAAGLEVILDVVYNHTAEGNHLGPTLSFKGIDNGAYYRLVDGQQDAYYDTTGTGNSLNTLHPAALGLIMDSLRYWVQEMHVDGFRFDLAT